MASKGSVDIGRDSVASDSRSSRSRTMFQDRDIDFARGACLAEPDRGAWMKQLRRAALAAICSIGICGAQAQAAGDPGRDVVRLLGSATIQLSFQQAMGAPTFRLYGQVGGVH